MQDLTHKTVLITGAARGIGRGMAEAFLNAGANVAAADLGQAGKNARTKNGDWNYALASSDALNWHHPVDGRRVCTQKHSGERDLPGHGGYRNVAGAPVAERRWR